MRILVTADVHLAADHPERLAALEDVIRIGRENAVDVLLIAGDLFDAGVDIEAIKPALRERFSDIPFPTYVIPGNHDASAFREEDHFGDTITVLANRPFSQRRIGSVNLIAVPYIETDFGAVLDDLHAAHEADAENVLLIHGTLSSAQNTAVGDEDRYLPFTPEQLLETGADYVAAGHIHATSTKQTFGDNACVFVYPGSPVSITRSETGKRGAWIIDTEQAHLEHVHVDAPYFVREELDLIPGEATAKLSELEHRLASRDLTRATVLVEPAGFIEMDEAAFFNSLEEIVANAGSDGYEINQEHVDSASAVLDSGLYRAFERKLDERDAVDSRQLRRIVLQALSREARR